MPSLCIVPSSYRGSSYVLMRGVTGVLVYLPFSQNSCAVFIACVSAIANVNVLEQCAVTIEPRLAGSGWLVASCVIC